MMKSIVALFILTVIITNVNAQSTLEKCKILVGENAVDTVTVSDALKWADTKPICVKCEDDEIYELNKLNFRMILQDPFRNKDFGTTEKGIPLLGRKLLEQSKPGDTVFLRSATYIDVQGNDVSLPNVVFRIVE